VLKKLGVSFVAPPGSKIGADSDLLVEFQLPTGAHASLQVDRDVPLSAEIFLHDDLETATHGKDKAKVTMILSEPDAFVYRAPNGELWAEGAKKVGKDIFRGGVGATYNDKPDATREGDCLTLVAIVRSLEAAP
jgi:hypothetical protein